MSSLPTCNDLHAAACARLLGTSKRLERVAFYSGIGFVTAAWFSRTWERRVLCGVIGVASYATLNVLSAHCAKQAIAVNR